MDWRVKAQVQRVLSAVPGGRHANWLLQRHVTKGYPRRGAVLDDIVAAAVRHVEVVEGAVPRPLGDLRFLEFGAGWDLAGPLVFAGRGVRSQLLLDLRPHARPWLVADMVGELGRRGALTGVEADEDDLAATLEPLGITYRAPADARATGLADGSVDVVTSTNTLEHVPEPEIRAILREVHRLLAADGVCSFAVDYHDHYADVDPSLHVHDFLRFDDRQWRRWNCALHHQNRLRHDDYVRLFTDAGFEVEVTEVQRVPLPPGLAPAARFRDRAPDDLAAVYGWFVLRHRASGPRDP
jgi:SAM-dependent methyltransferase